ncbi:Uu.00g097330.m01.CDS01 [Anthostomella pinea]|uniref:Uu.00g097330.m01.CDS01 n=1 Tax=Anthostomella pinea TaxID=933095 RepID=A0AAI8VCE4_9PEZI|nr:Uu.00g097330.m01.CDS01 [Anthostomella pinea]
MDIYSYLRRPDPAYAAYYDFNPDVDDDFEYLQSRGYGQLDGPVMPGRPTSHELRDSVNAISDEITKAYTELKVAYAANGKVILEQWVRMTKEERTSALQKAFGNGIAQQHRPDIRLLLKALPSIATGRFKVNPGTWTELTKHREVFKTPQINIEDLALFPEHLGLLWRSRATNHPVLFWRFDLEASYLARHTKVLVGPFLPRYVVTFSDLTPYANLVALTSEAVSVGIAPEPKLF